MVETTKALRRRRHYGGASRVSWVAPIYPLLSEVFVIGHHFFAFLQAAKR
jgi:hypothetical protein